MKKKTVVITGSSGGLGKSLVQKFKEKDYCIIGIDKREIKNKYLDQFYLCDFRNQTSIKRICDVIKKSQIDIFINNAAYLKKKEFFKTESEDILDHFNINCLSVFLFAKYLKGNFFKNKTEILNIGSIHSSLTKKNFLAYALSKASLEFLTKSLSLELYGKCQINMFRIGAMDTQMLKKNIKKKQLFKLKKLHPNNKIITPSELSDFIYNHCKLKNSYRTGSIINIDGSFSNRLLDPQ